MTMSALKKLRLKAGMTQSEVGNAVGVSQPNYQRWESGSAPIPDGKQKILARALGASVEELLGKPPAFDMLGIDAEIQDDRTYFGEVAIHFVKGDPILLPITEGERSRLFDQLHQENTFIVTESMDNRIVFIRSEAVTDVYFSSDAYDDYGPEDQKYADHLGLLPDDDFWKIIEYYECPDLLEDEFEQDRIDAVLQNFYLTEQRLDELIEEGRIAPEDRASALAENAERCNELADRARNVQWQFSSGQVRRESTPDSESLYEVFSRIMSNNDADFLDRVIYLPMEGGYHRTIAITISSLDYIAIPKHKFQEGMIACREQELDRAESE